VAVVVGIDRKSVLRLRLQTTPSASLYRTTTETSTATML
jgi:hypothetical protein